MGRFIGATTDEDYSKYIENSELASRFHVVRVPELSVQNVITILRGVKQHYEEHHSIEITDGALIAAATLAHRSIAGRCLPECAFDLVDSAAANILVQMSTEPAAIKRLGSKQHQLTLEAKALERVSDPRNQLQLAQVKDSLAKIAEELNSLIALHNAYKEKMKQLNVLKEKLASANRGVEVMGLDAHLKGVEAQIKVVPHLPVLFCCLIFLQLTEEVKQYRLCTDTVGPEQVLEVVSMYTGIRLGRLADTEVETALHLRDKLQQRIIGQTKAIETVAKAVLRCQAGYKYGKKPMGKFMVNLCIM
ncbi:ATP-dependent chaperone ClpB [Pelomyxa schiedti]|nr:ATP-dependent chaperone ClpB [Pelomyxa schiedti]